MTVYDPRRRSLRRFIVLVGLGSWINLSALYAVIIVVRADVGVSVMSLVMALTAASVLAGAALTLLAFGFLYDGPPSPADDTMNVDSADSADPVLPITAVHPVERR